MSAPVDFATVVLLDIATALGAVSLLYGIEALRNIRRAPPPPSPSEPGEAPAPPPAKPPVEPGAPFLTLFGDSLPELRAALANFDLVHEITNADGYEPGAQERMAFVYAQWALYQAAGRLRRVYNAKLDEASAGAAA